MSGANATISTTTRTTTETTTISSSGGLGGGGVAAIIIVLFILAGLAVGGYIAYRKIKERRRSHGEYRPQFEEYQHAKNLPYLQPPAIEGLI